jgi:cell wall-associated NlpC family hydrolase
VYSAVAAAIAALFTPMPALADPAAAPQDTLGIAVPDIGSRPMALGTLALPGQKTSTPTATPTLSATPTSPALQAIEKGRNEISALGDQLIQVGQDRDLARDQHAAAQLKFTQNEEVLRQAQTAAADAAAEAVREAAAMPPGMVDSGLSGLGDLARLQQGQGDTEQAIARQIEQAQINAQIALDEQTLSAQRYTTLAAQYAKLNSQLSKKQAAQQTLELSHQDELNAAEATQTATDSRLGASYLAGEEAGRGADARAMQALQFALAQRGDPYVWSEEGPDQYDCSGLMYAAYRSVGFSLTRVSRDQYWQTRNKVVDKYSLLPGDLLFFSSSNSWRGIHHVAMYAGDGMMVEAPRTGLNVRLTPVRWSRLFQATRVFGSVEGVVQGPNLGAPDPDPAGGGAPADPTDPTDPTNPTSPTNPTTPGTPRPSTTPPSTPPSSHPTTPPTTPPTSKPTTPPTSPSSPSTPPTSPSSPPPSSPSPTTNPPTTTKPPATDPTTEAPSGGGSSSGAGPSSGGGSSSGGDSPSGTGSSSGGSSPSGGGSSSSAAGSASSSSASSGSSSSNATSTKSSSATTKSSSATSTKSSGSASTSSAKPSGSSSSGS